MKRRKSERTKLIEKCDDLVRAIIRLRDKWCQKTYSRQNLQVAHFISRENLHLRWNLDNVVLLNAGVHKNWAHVHHSQFRQFMIDRIGKKAVEELEFRDRVPCGPMYDSDIILTKNQLRITLKEVQNAQNS